MKVNVDILNFIGIKLSKIILGGGGVNKRKKCDNEYNYGSPLVPGEKIYFIWRPSYSYMAAANYLSGVLRITIWRPPYR